MIVILLTTLPFSKNECKITVLAPHEREMSVRNKKRYNFERNAMIKWQYWVQN